MQGELNVYLAAALLAAACVVLLGTALVFLSLALKANAQQRRRLARVGRRRQSGALEIDETRLHTIRRKEEAGALAAIVAAAARAIPLFDLQRLKADMRRGEVKLSPAGFVAVAAALGVLIALAAILGAGLSPLLSVPPSLFAGLLAAHAFVRLRAEMMSERIMKQLPLAIDTIIRGVRAGLPVVESIANVGEDFEDPIGGHFRTIAERVQFGEPLDVALWRTAEFVDRPEMDFLAISISIQMETGGSLSEALGNLAALLRAREAMKLKIRAISSEAKASAMIIGALPFVMLILLALLTPDYVGVLFTDPRGQLMLLAGLGSIGLGAVVMWRMTKFEI